MKPSNRFVVALGTIFVLAFGFIPQAEAYDVVPKAGGGRVVQVLMSGIGDAQFLAAYPSYAADVVLYVARLRGMKIERTRDSIAGEIRAHALAYISAYGGRTQQAQYIRERANPMDIEMWPAPWWYYILD